MTQRNNAHVVRHWTLESAKQEQDRIVNLIAKRGLTIADLNYRADEWDLDREERALLDAYKRFTRMITFASEASSV